MSSLKLKHSGGNSMSIEAPATNPASNLALKLPATIGSANQILKNSGTAGTLGWSSIIENSDGDLGIGTASPSHKLHVVSSDTDTAFFKGRFVRVDGAASSDSPRVNFSLDGTDKTSLMCNRTDSSLNIETLTSAPIKLTTNSTERMRITDDGQLCIGNSSPAFTNTLCNIERTNGNLLSLYKNGGNDDHALTIQNQRANGSTYASFILINNSSGSGVGSIAANGSSTNYNTSSDYRLKENVTAISDGITRLKTLKPSRFNFKVDKDTTVDGFLAHEVTAVPEATSGTKDEVDSDNKPIYQGIDQSKLVPLLTAALQEAITKIETLETKVAALEAG